MSASAEILTEVPIFRLLDDKERAALAEMMEVRQLESGKIIFEFGDAGDEMFIVTKGSVQVYVEKTDGEMIVLGENTPGDVFGEISLLDGGPRTATAIATADSEVLVLSRDHLYDFLRSQPHAAMDLLSVMGNRLRATDELLRTQVTRNANVEEEEALTFGERVADKVAAFGGSWTFILTFGMFLLAWMALNIVMASGAFDPYPFILLNLLLSTLAALQAPVIMMSQNRQSSKDRLKADLDYEINLKAELEIAHLHNKVDKLYETMQQNFAAQRAAK